MPSGILKMSLDNTGLWVYLATASIIDPRELRYAIMTAIKFDATFITNNVIVIGIHLYVRQLHGS
jgi:hypothetical protein